MHKKRIRILMYRIHQIKKLKRPSYWTREVNSLLESKHWGIIIKYF